MSPSKLSSRPTMVTPALYADLTTARMTALRPGASPPPVNTPIFLIVGIQQRETDGEKSLSVMVPRSCTLTAPESACYTHSPSKICPRAASSAGRALRSQCRGQGFDPPAVHQFPP